MNVNPQVTITYELGDAQKDTYANRLWAEADKLYTLKQPLRDYSDELYREAETLRLRRQSPGTVEQLQRIEAKYWEIMGKLSFLAQSEEAIADGLERLDAGTISHEELELIVPTPKPEDPHLSKKKAAIRAEKERTGIDPREADWDLYANYGSTLTTHLTTGRNLSQFKGNASSWDAESRFYEQTADTHGGKVPHGKKDDMYTSANGRVVRKK